MRNIKFSVFLLLLSMLFLFNFTLKSYAISAASSSIILKIENRYKQVHSISAYFYQKEIMPGYSQNMSYRGNFYYEYPGKMAWVYTYPIQKRQVLKNNNLYIVNSKIKKVTIINVGREKGGFPPNIVALLGNLTRYFMVKNVSTDTKTRVIAVELKPLNLQLAREIYIGFAMDSFKITSLKILTHQDQTISFSYSRVEFDSPINSSIFDINFSSSYRVIKEN